MKEDDPFSVLTLMSKVKVLCSLGPERTNPLVTMVGRVFDHHEGNGSVERGWLTGRGSESVTWTR
jgi:hypothetical protein